MKGKGKAHLVTTQPTDANRWKRKAIAAIGRARQRKRIKRQPPLDSSTLAEALTRHTSGADEAPTSPTPSVHEDDPTSPLTEIVEDEPISPSASVEVVDTPPASVPMPRGKLRFVYLFSRPVMRSRVYDLDFIILIVKHKSVSSRAR